MPENQICLRCNVKPALNDGSDEGEYYCKECIEIRKTIDENLKKENKNKENNQKIKWESDGNGNLLPLLDNDEEEDGK
jgi:late competence protein required for DNA uptake (superfamily II DNA/RNA helicase)